MIRTDFIIPLLHNFQTLGLRAVPNAVIFDVPSLLHAPVRLATLFACIKPSISEGLQSEPFFT